MNTLLEMADFFIGFNIDKKKVTTGKNKLTQNGGTDRVKPPHFHLYSSDKSTKIYSYEIDLQRLLCEDRIFFSKIIDKENNIDIVPGENGQINYAKYANRIYSLMQLKPNVKKPLYIKDCFNNIEAAIRIFNNDADFPATVGIDLPTDEKLLYILSLSSDRMKILPKYNVCFKYISKEIREKYKQCFVKPF